MNIKTRRFKISDSENISDFIIKQFKRFNCESVNEEGLNFFLDSHTTEHIKTFWNKDHVIIIEYEKKIIGIGRAKSNGWITHCYVDEKYFHKGLGKKLMQRMEQWIKRNNIKTVFLNSSIFALEFYKRLGYKTIGGMKKYHDIPLYKMRKELN